MAKNQTAMGPGIMLSLNGDRAVFTIDLTGDFGPSASGKTRKVATTGGNQTIAGGLKCGINVYDPDVTRTLAASDFSEWAGAVGQNCDAKVSSTGILTVTIDTGADLGLSASGKSRKVASTGGNQTLPNALKIGINIYDPIPGFVAPKA